MEQLYACFQEPLQGPVALRRAFGEQIRGRQARSSSKHRQQQRSRSNEHDAQPVHQVELLAEEEHAEDRDHDDRELVDRRHACGVAELQRAEIGKPGGAGGKA